MREKRFFSRLFVWLFTLVGCFAWGVMPQSSEGEEAECEEAICDTAWFDTSRDVYVDGVLERGVEAYVAEEPDRLAIAGGSLQEILVVDLESLEILTLPKNTFEPNLKGATSDSEPVPTHGRKATRVVDRASAHYLLEHRLQTILISPHQGQEGPVDVAELWQTAPSWERRMDFYEPAPEAVKILAEHSRAAKITVVLGTWCGDSRNYVPSLMAALRAAGNPLLEVEVISILRGFEQPAALIRDRQIINVPTILVEEEGNEIGRMIETPALETVEEDIAAILSRQPGQHDGRYTRGPQKAKGRYLYRDEEGRLLGHEDWVLYVGDAEGRLLHSEIVLEGGNLEVFHRRREDGSTRSLEITRRGADSLSRTRVWEDDGAVSVNTRGDYTGIVRQELTLPEGGVVWAPGIAEAGFDVWHRDRGGENLEIHGLRLGASPVEPSLKSVAGAAGRAGWDRLPEESIQTPSGALRALHFRGTTELGTGDWWIHPETGLTLKASLNGVEVVLAELE